ncbi:MAG TPA: hypothetical protein VGJ32_11900 [Solirubrobacteraceae bacterium]
MRRALLLTAVLALIPANARAADPGRWHQVNQTTLPLYYYQGITADPARNLYFDGIWFGLYRTDSAFAETGRNDDAIPPDVHAREHYDHIGDLTYDGAEGGRLLLPLECYYPVPGTDGNPCKQGAIGVADPVTLDWRYYVHLDPAEIPKAMWAEVSPNGKLIWTSSGDDLLAYRTRDVSPANAAPDHAPIRAVRRLANAVPPSGITGAAFVGQRLFVAGQDGDLFQVWSIDLETGARRLEIERTIVGESEGLASADVAGGMLHWLIQPYNEHALPTYGPANATLLSFAPGA